MSGAEANKDRAARGWSAAVVGRLKAVTLESLKGRGLTGSAGDSIADVAKKSSRPACVAQLALLPSGSASLDGGAAGDVAFEFRGAGGEVEAIWTEPRQWVRPGREERALVLAQQAVVEEQQRRLAVRGARERESGG